MLHLLLDIIWDAGNARIRHIGLLMVVGCEFLARPPIRLAKSAIRDSDISVSPKKSSPEVMLAMTVIFFSV